MESDDRTDTPRIIGDGAAGRKIYAYVYDHFGGHALTRDETSDYSMITDVRGWRWIRDFMQRLLAMDDGLEIAVCARTARETSQLFAECHCGQEDGQVNPPILNPPDICWTWLEASYERLGDVEGLCRLYAYRIITDSIDGRIRTEDEQRAHDSWYVRKLRDLAGDAWNDYVLRIIDLQERYHGDPMFHGRNPAYEALLSQEMLSDAAWKYCKARCRDFRDDKVIERLFAVMAHTRAEDSCDLLLEPLHDADSDLMRSDSERNVDRVCSILRLVAGAAGSGKARDEIDRLLRMYRSRKSLRVALEGLRDEFDMKGE
ncbi:hypothetical protein [Bifidobacterium parmae]|uniref:Uncharacterized protein n=1 Tax=Bifidobacterium parmae TaxID=361854 RepID=A0A2N5J326_9BIFI|nr:hypothetical protein [Bifidobacterium parmae]PLS28589.1 hypothetical protein Uis4E_1238 [Bifidobacterium parmae]